MSLLASCMIKKNSVKAETTSMRYIQIYLYTYSNERPLQRFFYLLLIKAGFLFIFNKADNIAMQMA